MIDFLTHLQVVTPELNFFEKVLEKGGPMALIAGALMFGFWKMLNRHSDILEKVQVRSDERAVQVQKACDERGKERNDSFLNQNLQIISDNRAHMSSLVQSVKDEHTQTRQVLEAQREVLDRVVQCLENKP